MKDILLGGSESVEAPRNANTLTVAQPKQQHAQSSETTP